MPGSEYYQQQKFFKPEHRVYLKTYSEQITKNLNPEEHCYRSTFPSQPFSFRSLTSADLTPLRDAAAYYSFAKVFGEITKTAGIEKFGYTNEAHIKKVLPYVASLGSAEQHKHLSDADYAETIQVKGLAMLERNLSRAQKKNKLNKTAFGAGGASLFTLRSPYASATLGGIALISNYIASQIENETFSREDILANKNFWGKAENIEQYVSLLSSEANTQALIELWRNKDFLGAQQIKNAQQRAKAVSAQKDTLAAQSQQQAEVFLLDEDARRIRDEYSNDGTVVALYTAYIGSKNHATAYVEFRKKLNDHFESKQRVKEYIGLALASREFFSEYAKLTGSKLAGQLANGVGAGVQFFQGASEISNAVSLFTSAGDVITGVTGMLNGAGAILAGISVFFAIFDEEDETSEALQQMYSTMIAMWQDISNTLDTMEYNNQQRFELSEHNAWARFNYTVSLIEKNHKENLASFKAIQQSQKNLSNQMASFQEVVNSYLSYLTDKDVHVVISKMLISKDAALLEEENFKHYISELKTWLISQPRILDRTGWITIELEQANLIKELQTVINRTVKNAHDEEKVLNFPLGLYASLAQEVAKEVSEDFKNIQRKQLVNPCQWFAVAGIYYQLIKLGKEVILSSALEQQKQYFHQMQQVKQISQDTLGFFDQVANSASLWESLVNNYQQKFMKVQKKIEEKEIEFSKPLAEANIKFSLLETAQQNIDRFAAMQNAREIAKQFSKNFSWLGTPGIRDSEKVITPNNQGRPNSDVPGGDLGCYLTETQFNELHQAGFKDVFSLLEKNMYFSMAVFYKQITPGLIYNLYNIGTKSYYWDFSLNCVISIKIGQDVQNGQERYLRLWQGSLYQADFRTDNTDTPSNTPTGWDARGGCSGYTVRRNKIHGFESHLYNEFNQNHEKISQLIDNNVLAVARKAIVSDLPSNFFASLKEDYLKLIAFVQLLDPTFNPPKIAEAITNLEAAVKILADTGTAEALQAVAKIANGAEMKTASTSQAIRAPWQEELWAYMGNDFFSVEALQAKLKARLLDHPLWRMNYLPGYQSKLALPPIRAKAIAQEITALSTELDPNNISLRLKRQIANTQSKVSTQKQLLGSSFNNLVATNTVLQRLNTPKILPMHEPLAALKQRWSNSHGTEIEPETNHFNNPTPPQYDQSHWTPLQKLCANAATPLAVLQQTLASFPDHNSRLQQLNEATPKPLELAIQTLRDDIVAELLSNDASVRDINPSTRDFLQTYSNLPKVIQINGLLNFYEEMQKAALGDEPYIGKMLQLVKDCMGQLLHYKQYAQQSVVIFVGDSSRGKSTFCNFLNGTSYQKIIDDSGDPKWISNNERIRTGDSYNSETICPTVLQAINGQFIADPPGFEDNRGLPWKIAGGLNIQRLSQIFGKVQALVLTMMQSDVSDLVKSKNTLEMMGKIVSHNVQLMNNVILLITRATDKTTDEIYAKFQKAATKYITNERTRFFLTHIKKEQIILADAPSDELRQRFLTMTENMTPQPFAALHLESYYHEVEKFKKLIESLASYNQTSSCNAQQYARYIANVESGYVMGNQTALAGFEEISELQSSVADDALMAQTTQLNKKIQEQAALRRDMLSLAEQTVAYIQNHYPPLPPDFDPALTKDPLKQWQAFNASLTIANEFLTDIEPLVVACTGSSWPLPGACAISMKANPTKVRAENNVFSQILTPLYSALFSTLDRLPTLAWLSQESTVSALPEVRKFNGVPQASCVYQWPAAFAWALPKTTHQTNGNPNVLGNAVMCLCEPEQHKIEFKFSDSSLQLLMRNPREWLAVINLGPRDAQFLNQAANATSNSFVTAATSSFTYHGLRRYGVAEANAELVKEMLYCIMLYALYGAPAVFMHIAMLWLGRQHVISPAITNKLSIMISIALSVFSGGEEATCLTIAAQMLCSIVGASLGDMAGKAVAGLGARRSSPPIKTKPVQSENLRLVLYDPKIDNERHYEELSKSIKALLKTYQPAWLKIDRRLLENDLAQGKTGALIAYVRKKNPSFLRTFYAVIALLLEEMNAAEKHALASPITTQQMFLEIIMQINQSGNSINNFRLSLGPLVMKAMKK